MADNAGIAPDWRQPEWLRSFKSAVTPYNVGGSVTDALAGNDLTRGIAPEAGYAANVMTGAVPALAVPAGGALMRQAAAANALRGAPAAGGMAAQAGMSTPKMLGALGGVSGGGYLLTRALRKKPKAAPPPEEPKPQGAEAGYLNRMERQLEEEGK